MDSRTRLFFICAPILVAVAAADQMTIQIGPVTAMTGPIAHLGKDNDKGAMLANEELNAKSIAISGKK